MNAQTNTNVTTQTKRKRIAKGILVATTNQARLACMSVYTTIYIYNPINYNVIRQILIDN